MKPTYLFTAACALFLALAIARSEPSGAAAELFNGKDLTGWQNSGGGDPMPGWSVKDGVIVRIERAGYLWTEGRYGNFILDLEFKTSGNSGIFIRTDNRKNSVQTGIEIQVDRPGGPSKHSVGAIYDLVAPSKNAGKADEWNHIVITARDNQITVELNGENIAEMDLDRWTEPRKNPDGSKNKFKTPLKEFKREGHIGFQDHGAAVSYRNIRLTALD